MEKEKFFKMRMRHIFPILMLLFLFTFLGIMPETKVQASPVPRSDLNNLSYTFPSANGELVSTTANPGETTVLVFGHTGCGFTRSTLNSLSSCEWIKRPDIRVVFVDVEGHDLETVSSYADGYQCPDLIFCHDEMYENFEAMLAYAQLFGLNDSKYPFTVLIDKNNKVKNYMQGAKTAAEILNEIKKFENIEDSGSLTPPSGSDSGIENFAYGLKTIDGATVSTKATPDQTTVLLFGYTTCGLTKGTLKEIDGSDWISRSDIRVIFADTKGASLEETKAFAQDYTSGKIIFCHDASCLNFNFSLTYLKLVDKTGGTFPYIVLIDKHNKIQLITLGPKTAAEIITEIEKIANKDTNAGGSSTGGSSTGGNDQNTGNNQNPPTPAASVSNVSGLKAKSTSKNVKLTWDSVSNASGYVVYQYNTPKKEWEEKASLGADTTSYTIKKLSPSMEYRFAVRAFIQLLNGESAFSASYSSLDTATAPNAVKFKVKPGKKKATVNWTKVKGADGYIVYYKTKAKGSWKKLKSTKSTSYTKKKLKSGKTYYFTVKAIKKYNKETYASSFTSKKVKIK